MILKEFSTQEQFLDWLKYDSGLSFDMVETVSEWSTDVSELEERLEELEIERDTLKGQVETLKAQVDSDARLNLFNAHEQVKDKLSESTRKDYKGALSELQRAVETYLKGA